MKEIIIVTNYLTNGGAERVLSELIGEWIHSGYKVSIFQIRASVYTDSYNIPKEVEVTNIDPKTDSRFFRRFIQASQLIKLLNLHKNATVLAFVNAAILVVGMCSPFIKNKIVFSERCDPEQSPPTRLQRFVRDNIYRCADICVFQTPDAMEHFCKSVQKKGVIIPNPINDNLPAPYDGIRRKAIVAVCRLDKQKNIPMLIYAFAKLNKDYPDYKLEIYGRGDLEEEINELIFSLNLQENVFLMGFCQNIYEKMRDAAMYVSSSNYEGISNSMLEALGMGVPTICTDCPCGGARMYIQNGINGILVPTGDDDALYLAMKKILEDKNFANDLSHNSINIKNELLPEKIANEWLEVIDN